MHWQSHGMDHSPGTKEIVLKCMNNITKIYIYIYAIMVPLTVDVICNRRDRRSSSIKLPTEKPTLILRSQNVLQANFIGTPKIYDMGWATETDERYSPGRVVIIGSHWNSTRYFGYLNLTFQTIKFCTSQQKLHWPGKPFSLEIPVKDLKTVLSPITYLCKTSFTIFLSLGNMENFIHVRLWYFVINFYQYTSSYANE